MNDFMQLQERENQRSPFIPEQAALVGDKPKAPSDQGIANPDSFKQKTSRLNSFGLSSSEVSNSEVNNSEVSNSEISASEQNTSESITGTEDSTQEKTLSESVERTVSGYLDAMQGQEVEDLYELVLSEIEAPLLESVMKVAGDNQSLTAKILGLNRGTLRKKLKKYGML